MKGIKSDLNNKGTHGMNNLVSLVSWWSHETGETIVNLVSLVSHPFRGETNETRSKTDGGNAWRKDK